MDFNPGLAPLLIPKINFFNFYFAAFAPRLICWQCQRQPYSKCLLVLLCTITFDLLAVSAATILQMSMGFVMHHNVCFVDSVSGNHTPNVYGICYAPSRLICWQCQRQPPSKCLWLLLCSITFWFVDSVSGNHNPNVYGFCYAPSR